MNRHSFLYILAKLHAKIIKSKQDTAKSFAYYNERAYTYICIFKNFIIYTTFKKAEKGWHTNKLHWNEAIWPSRGHGFIYNYVERTKSVKKVGDKSLDIFTFLIY